MQFERPEAETWGSPQLATAVVEYVAVVGRGIDVFEGFSKDQMNRRLGILAASVAAILLFGALPSRAMSRHWRIVCSWDRGTIQRGR